MLWLRELRAKSAERAAWQARRQADDADQSLAETKRELATVDQVLAGVMNQAASMPQLTAIDRADIADAVTEGKMQFVRANMAVQQAEHIANVKQASAAAAHKTQMAAQNAQKQWEKLIGHIERSQRWAEENLADQTQELDYVVTSKKSG
jgi:hypothetical protein